MNTFLDFQIIGDPAFDFFFSITASINLMMYLGFIATSFFRGR
jgi:hypothetical protein